MKYFLKIFFTLFLAFAFSSIACSSDSDDNKEQLNKGVKEIPIPVYSKETDKKFSDVIEDLLVIIGEHNFRLNQHARIGKAIADRNNINFPLATVVHFCNLTYAKELLEIAPDYLLRMPCRVSVRQTESNSTIIETWLLPEDDQRTIKFAKKINAILMDIVNYSGT